MAATRTWTQEDDRILMKNWNKETLEQLAVMLRCEISTIHRKAKRLRDMGVDLPERKKANKAPVKEEIKPDDLIPKSVGVLGNIWSDNWKINPPSRSRLMAGR